MDKMDVLLRQKAPSGLIGWKEEEEMALALGLSLHEAEGRLLAQGVLPQRYQRNAKSITREEQCRLFQSRVAVIGCGGLGGYLLEELARLGIASISAWDYDSFAEHNLNRQLLSDMDTIGLSKVETAAKRVQAINPAVKFQAFNRPFAAGEGEDLLAGHQVVVDALDSIPVRKMLAAVCQRLSLPLVHGAIAGWCGQVCTQFPGEDSLETIYRNSNQEQGVESEQGVLAFAPAVVASLQVAEVVKILLGRGELLRKRILLFNLLDMEFEVLDL
ncbi:HesA/MoeB/ThiF family protein [Syntrophomonas wolfei]|jgi:molybdopterin/thiamine biosynthesis adenylyltransferase|uniref:Thiamine biosynthesis protein ThiF n=1 Tax=Syntrophomonas wolfei TaxID=863 RepID=A0A354YW86_9FIRM|nr:HesA/MoeB/ThiF family protein [Syntrophomonas wolfei]HBK52961.1 thiamine biosynthesis protein ThiF [Syntrophomonas wolfei]